MVNPRAWLAEAIATYCLVFFGPVSIGLAVVAFGTDNCPIIAGLIKNYIFVKKAEKETA